MNAEWQLHFLHFCDQEFHVIKYPTCFILHFCEIYIFSFSFFCSVHQCRFTKLQMWMQMDGYCCYSGHFWCIWPELQILINFESMKWSWKFQDFIFNSFLEFSCSIFNMQKINLKKDAWKRIYQITDGWEENILKIWYEIKWPRSRK